MCVMAHSCLKHTFKHKNKPLTQGQNSNNTSLLKTHHGSEHSVFQPSVGFPSRNWTRERWIAWHSLYLGGENDSIVG